MITVLILAAWAIAFWFIDQQEFHQPDKSTVMMDEKSTYSLAAMFLLLWNWGII